MLERLWDRLSRQPERIPITDPQNRSSSAGWPILTRISRAGVALTQVTQNNEMQAGGVGQPGLERAMLKRACRLSVLTLLAASGAALAQAPPTMTFFVSSVGNGPSGGDYGGLAGADLRCQSLAAAAGAGHWN